MDEHTTKNGTGKIQQYIESRLWKSKLRGAKWKISTAKLVEEIEAHYLGGKKLKPDSPQMKTIHELIQEFQGSFRGRVTAT